MAEVANANPGVVVMEAFHYQYHPLTRRLVEIVRSGELGTITNIDVAFSAPAVEEGRHPLPARPGRRSHHGHGLLPDQPACGCWRRAPRDQRRRQALLAGCRPRHGRPLLAARRRDAPTSAVRCSPPRCCACTPRCTGTTGRSPVFNPFAPQLLPPHEGHHRRWAPRKERFSRRATYDFQLEAFRAAVEDGAPFPTTAADAIRTMELIDAIYVAAGLPVREPTPVA